MPVLAVFAGYTKANDRILEKADGWGARLADTVPPCAIVILELDAKP